MSEERGIRLQWVVDEDSPEAQRAVVIEETKLAQAQQIHKDWLEVQAREYELRERSHKAWIETNERAIAVQERIAVALEALVQRP